IWALARRTDGIERVLAMAGDTRPWIEPVLLAAFAEVAAPMTDAQIETLRGTTASPDFERLRDRHLERTRLGAPHGGADARIRYVPPPRPYEQTREDILSSDPEFDTLPSDRLRWLLRNGTKTERARAIGALARRATDDPILQAEVVEAVADPDHRAMR